MKKFSQCVMILLISSFLLLSGCGGGGDVNIQNNAKVILSNLRLGEIPNINTNDSSLRAAYDLLQEERRNCGFGLLTPVNALNEAAAGHANWQLLHQTFSDYQEVTQGQGFTGASAADRMVTSGYESSSKNVESYSLAYQRTGSDKTSLGQFAIRQLLNAPYLGHRLLAEGYRDVGLALRSDLDVGNLGIRPARSLLEVHLAYRVAEDAQWQGTDDILTYPCQGSTGVATRLSVFEPSPLGNKETVTRDIMSTPLGTTFFIISRSNSTLLDVQATLTEEDTGQSVQLQPPITSANNPNKCCHFSHVAFVTANEPLKVNTTYRMMITGVRQHPELSDLNFSKVWSFSTGSN